MTGRRNLIREAALLSALVPVAIMATGCSEGGDREYSIPKNLCGIAVQQDLYAPLFGPGDSLKGSGTIPDSEEQSLVDRCRYFTGGEDIAGDGGITVYGKWTKGGQSTHDQLKTLKSNEKNRGEAKRFPGKYVATAAPTSAQSVVVCRNRDKAVDTEAEQPWANQYVLTIGTYGSWEQGDNEASRKRLGKLVQAAMEAVQGELPCKHS
ncbi:hypothetical protein [Streptomyces sp. NPDC048172]|uniref:hypothetical protein n=1 Tax=Streptomyces sp. NPDC048172 TaxID=3365505 RepID=UPI0037244B4D